MPSAEDHEGFVEVAREKGEQRDDRENNIGDEGVGDRREGARETE